MRVLGWVRGDGWVWGRRWGMVVEGVDVDVDVGVDVGGREDMGFGFPEILVLGVWVEVLVGWCGVVFAGWWLVG